MPNQVNRINKYIIVGIVWCILGCIAGVEAQLFPTPHTPVSETTLLINKIDIGYAGDYKDGIPVNCYQSCIDQLGYVWITSAQGFFVYDGKRMKKVDLPCHDFEVVAVYSDSSFVFGWTYSGEIFRIDVPTRRISIINKALASSEKNGNFDKYVRLGDSAYFFKNGQNSLVYHVKDLFAPQFPQLLSDAVRKDRYPSRGIIDLGELLIGYFRFRNSPYYEDIRSYLAQNNINHVYCQNEFINFGTDIYHLANGNINRVFSDPEAARQGNYIYSYILYKNALWVNLSNHTLVVRPIGNEYNPYLPQTGVPIPVGTKGWLMTDNMGSILFASENEGLFKITVANNGNIGYYNVKQQFKTPSNDIRYLGMQNENFYIGYHIPVVDVYSDAKRIRQVVGDTMHDKQPVKLYTETHNGQKGYMVTGSMVYRFRQGSLHLGKKDLSTIKDTWIYKDTLLVKNKFREYLRIPLNNDSVELLRNFKERSNTFCYDEKKKGYYQGSLYGLYFNDYKVKGPLADERILSIRNFGGDILVATYKGIYIIPEGKMAEDAVAVSGTQKELCLQLGWDGGDEYYTLTKTNLKIIDKRQHNARVLFSYNEMERQLFFNCFLLTRDDIFIGTTKGVLKISRSHDYNKNKPIPRIYLRNTDSIQSNLLAGKSVINYTSNLSIRFEVDVVSYYFEPLEMTWWIEDRNNKTIRRAQRIRNQEFTLNNIDPGEYTIKVFVNSRQNNWSKTLSHKVYIRPRWWQQTWLWVAVLAIGIMGGTVITYMVIKRYSRKRMKQILNKNKVLKLQNQLQLSRFKPHFIFNSFTPIQNLILKNKNQEALEYTEALSKLMRKSMHMIDAEYVLLSQEIDFLTQYILIQQYRFANVFQFECFVSPELSVDRTLVPSMIIQPLLENAIEHGIQHKDKTSRISLKIIKTQNPAVLKIIVFNSGNRFPKNFSPVKDRALEIISRRIQLIKLEYQVGRISFDNQDDGALVNIEIPAKYT